MIVLGYCENGSVLEYMQKRKKISLQTKLTFCAEVAQGLEYLSARKVVRIASFVPSVSGICICIYNSQRITKSGIVV